MVLGSQKLQPQVQATGIGIRVRKQVHCRGWWNSRELSVCPGDTGLTFHTNWQLSAPLREAGHAGFPSELIHHRDAVVLRDWCLAQTQTTHKNWSETASHKGVGFLPGMQVFWGNTNEQALLKAFMLAEVYDQARMMGILILKF